ncbi:MAG: type I methionyl aminopeptidase [Phycisphaerae bacterium]|nr:type I methionyl aminopeptidase [Phycisphaerae bacterium]
MAICLKSTDQIDHMRQAGRLVHEALQRCRAICEPGVTTARLDQEAEEVLAESGAIGLFKNYPAPSPNVPPFPAVTCVSVNEQVVHGIPGDRVVADGDLVSIDFGVRINGWCGDAATTILVGQVRPAWKKLCQVTEHVLQVAIENLRPGRRWSEIARLMQNYAEESGVSVVKDFVGHGIGEQMHEEPKVPNFVSKELLRHDITLEPGMVLAIEPMCALGGEQVRLGADGWTVVTASGEPAAHYEHTVAVTEDGCEVLTDGG